MSIPKIIHYVWFGENEPGEMEKKCIESWKRICPDYEIKRWDESSYDFSGNRYAREAYEKKKYAFVSDYVRLDVLYKYGGIYLDTDVELIKKPDSLLEHDGFISLEHGAPSPYGRLILANSGSGIGAIPGCEMIGRMLRQYEKIPFIKESGELDLTACTERQTELLKKYGFNGRDEMQSVGDFVILPSEYFSPLDYMTGRLKKTDNTIGIHLYNGSWTNGSKSALSKLKSRLKCTGLGMYMMRIRYTGAKKLTFIMRNLLNKARLLLKRLLGNKGVKARGSIYLSAGTRLRLNRESSFEMGKDIESDGSVNIVTGFKGKLKVGDRVYFNNGTEISCLGSISIGDDSLFGFGTRIIDNNHIFGINGVSRKCRAGKIEIGKNCWIGSNVCILKGAKIGDNCVIGAGCIINGEIPANTLVRQQNNLVMEEILDREI
ncbi:MAG: glycosyltransferase [Eubacteriales bacterium]|nr:glycosyltransferase [Eubacteriales bacterium]